MAARMKCIPCQMGECEGHIAGHTRAGVMGGWTCPCTHSEYERKMARSQWRERRNVLMGRLTSAPRTVPAARRPD